MRAHVGEAKKLEWSRKLAAYQTPSRTLAVRQLLTSVLPYLVIMATMMYAVAAEWSVWIVIGLVPPAVAFLTRSFIIFHDCTHGSFVHSKRWNKIIGYFTGLLAFTAFEPWRVSHLQHHATTGQLDHRGFGDVMTMTLEEYEVAGRWRRFCYRVYRNPAVLFLVGSILIFFVTNRVKGLRRSKGERRGVLLSNAGILALAAGASAVFGVVPYLAVQLPVMFVAGIVGVWLFYVQHQFDPGYWARDGQWDKYDAAVHGSSYYKLPTVLRWITGNIGIHHVHHLRPRIPNYRLEKANQAFPEAEVKPLTLWQSFKAVRYNLWSEMQGRFLSFRQAARLMRGKTNQKAT